MREEGLLWGEVTAAAEGKTTVRGGQEFRAVSFLAPYGIYSLPPQGARAAVLWEGGAAVGLGVETGEVELEPGEVLLRSAGGASLLLKNDGSILLNGKPLAAG